MIKDYLEKATAKSSSPYKKKISRPLYCICLDKGAPLITTLNQFSAGRTSIPISIRYATIAAKVEHVIFFPEDLEGDIA